ncbi:putative DNA modification/repair radical SAM protein [Clostridium beijerinckii]|uniref:DNA modification/repair radical SAM protein n=1 Tax=Clostridium beijerinckii TaxID=1520 RepID=A0AB74VDR6_CLOBE|nr:putative DNA modification/repair radical SAM protein [Clostridium beijerinckii]NRZ28945.1 putative DNA modification/repair radical SAM protein [Clostridium beijerinckii]NYB95282.1 putative DNA modification/repair radical SAM protein [Clostridium beijerinckii]OOM22556.1 radical SAM superfamily protein [Clostridium beijerinckii]QUN34608.1 putative DNA modification/repair radical SAM protein [Clostridium beijerinckii]SQB00426.1 radical SAM domain-containing protein [Clostridium beijerinckii]
MDLMEKLKILSNAAKYDVSCSSSGSKRQNAKNGIGNASEAGICHSFTPDGRCISLLKILFSNDCIFDCKYCINGSSRDFLRVSFTPDEICSLSINFYRRNYIEGLFLSSAVIYNPNYTMELLLKTVKKLRIENKFNGYIHLKVIPGADNALIEEAGKFVDRMSVNIELPSSNSLKLLAPQKSKEKILQPMKTIKNSIINYSEMKKSIKSTPLFVPGGQSTQLIVGATPESDGKILKLSEALYNKYSLKRVYYSAYVPVIKDNNLLPDITHPPMLREHRLYQADWLLRYYGFKANELLKNDDDNFDLNFDPKTHWALSNLNEFPVEINKVSYEKLLRIPGIGVTSAKKILKIRRVHNLTFDDLRNLRVVLKRAKYFITCNGKYHGDVLFDTIKIKNKLLEQDISKSGSVNPNQISFFDNTSFNDVKLPSGIILPKDNISLSHISSIKNENSLNNIIPKSNILTLGDKITSLTGEF